MGNSPLVNCVVRSPNHSGRRTHSIDTITPHCVVGQLTAETIGNCFLPTSRRASCNYGIGKDGRVLLCVDEDKRSWCSSSEANDQRAITIECASDLKEPYAFNNIVYNKLIDLCVDICKRNGKTKLLWLGDKAKTLAYKPKSDEMLLTVHRWFSNMRSCPGDWMYARMGDLANTVTTKLNGIPNPNTGLPETFTIQVIDKPLNIRKGPGINYGIVGKINDNYKYTIVEEKNGWGLLKSGAGWINLGYTKRV